MNQNHISYICSYWRKIMEGGDEAMATNKKTNKLDLSKLVRKPQPKIVRVGV